MKRESHSMFTSPARTSRRVAVTVAIIIGMMTCWAGWIVAHASEDPRPHPLFDTRPEWQRNEPLYNETRPRHFREDERRSRRNHRQDNNDDD